MTRNWLFVLLWLTVAVGCAPVGGTAGGEIERTLPMPGLWDDEEGEEEGFVPGRLR